MQLLKPLTQPYSIGQAPNVVGTAVSFLDADDNYFCVHVSSGNLRLYHLNDAGYIRQVGDVQNCDIFTALPLTGPLSKSCSALHIDEKAIKEGSAPLCIVVAAQGKVVYVYTVTLDRSSPKSLLVKTAIELPLMGPVSCLATNGLVLAASVGSFISVYELAPLLDGQRLGPQAPVKINTSPVTDLYFCRGRPTELISINTVEEIVFLNLDIGSSNRETLFEQKTDDVSDDIFLFGSAYPFPLGSVFYSTDALCMTTGTIGMALADPNDGAIQYQNIDLRALVKNHDFILGVHKSGDVYLVTCGRFNGTVTVFTFAEGKFSRYLVLSPPTPVQQPAEPSKPALSPAAAASGAPHSFGRDESNEKRHNEAPDADMSVRAIAWGRKRAIALNCMSMLSVYELDTSVAEDDDGLTPFTRMCV